jgi:hypothetical protein
VTVLAEKYSWAVKEIEMKIRTNVFSGLAALIVLTSHAGVSANDNNRNLGLSPGPAPAMQSGVGLNAQIVIPFGAGSTTQRQDPWNLRLSAGPQLTWTAADDGERQRRLSPLLQFSLRPQHSNTFSIAGYNVMTRWAPSVSAAERAEGEAQEGSGMKAAGVFGVLLGAAAGVGVVMLLTGSDSDSCEPCDPAEGPCLPQPC